MGPEPEVGPHATGLILFCLGQIGRKASEPWLAENRDHDFRMNSGDCIHIWQASSPQRFYSDVAADEAPLDGGQAPDPEEAGAGRGTRVRALW